VYLDANGYDVVPVNPAQAGRQILGRHVYPNLAEAAKEHEVEIVDVFRPSREVPEIAEQAIEIGARVLWMQLGVVNHEAARRAREAGLEVVMDRCCKIEHARFFGGLRTIGLNTGVITSRLAMKIPEG
jgi:predicted CoA-binding protein